MKFNSILQNLTYLIDYANTLYVYLQWSTLLFFIWILKSVLIEFIIFYSQILYKDNCTTVFPFTIKQYFIMKRITSNYINTDTPSKHNCFNKVIIIFQHTCTFLNENIINDQQILLNEINTYSYFAVAMINKQPICHAGKSVYQGKRKTKFSFHKYAKRYVPKTFCSVPKAFCFVPKAFPSVLNAPCFVRTFQRSPGVVVHFRDCRQDI